MTDLQLLAAQHRVILNMPCSCDMPWKHVESQPLCQRCQVLQDYAVHIATSSVITSHTAQIIREDGTIDDFPDSA
jgi:hypothetical protein